MIKILLILGIVFISILFCLLQDYIFEKYETEKANEILLFIICFPIIVFLIYIGLCNII